jgi:hypothetical protein
MAKKIDPAVKAFIAYRRAKRIEQFESNAPSARRRTSRAKDVFFATEPTTPRGALCHLIHAWHERVVDEGHATEWHEAYLEVAAGRPAYVDADESGRRFNIREAIRFADCGERAIAASLLLRGIRMKTRRQMDSLAVVRQALAIVKAHPLPDADNEAVERHSELALTFLATPRAAQ